MIGKGGQAYLKKRMIFVISLGLVFSCTMISMETGMGSLPCVQADEGTDDGIIIEEISPDDWYSADQNQANGTTADGIQVIDGAEVVPWSEGEYAGLTVENELSDIDLYINDDVLSVGKEEIALAREDEVVFPEIFHGMYVAYFSSNTKAKYVLYFSAEIDPEDLLIYDFDAENGMAKKQTDADRICMEQEDLFGILMDKESSCVIVLKHAEKYPQIGIGISRAEAVSAGTADSGSGNLEDIVIDQIEEITPETVDVSEFVTETEYETEAVSEAAMDESSDETEYFEEDMSETDRETEFSEEILTEFERETEQQGETMTGFGSTENGETQSESETETGSPVSLRDAELLFVEGVESIPAAMLPFIDNQDILQVRMYYSDGSEQILTDETDSYGNTCEITYEDMICDDNSVSRTFTLMVHPAESVSEESMLPVEKSKTVVFRQNSGEEIDDIEADGKTSVRIQGKKNWVLVQLSLIHI